MDFMIPKAQQHFSVADEKKTTTTTNYNAEEQQQRGETETNKVVSSQLQIRSSAEALEKGVVLKRIRHHKCKNRVKSAFQALVGGHGQAQEKWMELGDAFTCP